MKTTTFLTLLLVIFAGALASEAKPLSYVGGTMVMQENDETGHTLSLDYTFTVEPGDAKLPRPPITSKTEGTKATLEILERT